MCIPSHTTLSWLFSASPPPSILNVPLASHHFRLSLKSCRLRTYPYTFSTLVSFEIIFCLVAWILLSAHFTHVYPDPYRREPLGAKVSLLVVWHPCLFTTSFRSFSAAGHTVLVFDYLLTLQDEASSSL